MKIKRVIHHDNEIPLWDLEVPNYHFYHINNGIKSHNSISHTFPQPCLSTGVEPAIFAFGWKRTRFNTGSYDKWEFYFIIYDDVKNYILKELERKKLKDTDDYIFIKELPTSVLDNDGKIGLKVKEIVEKYIDNLNVKSAYEIDPFNRVEMMATIQKWVDASISNTYNIPNDYPLEKLKDLVKYAYDNGMKSITVYRQGTREEIYTALDPITFNKYYSKEKDKVICKERPNDIIYNCAPKRPDVLDCDIHHCMVNGKPWVVLVSMFNGKPYEVFAGEYDSEVMHIPKKLKKGIIRKTKIKKDGKKKSIYNLEIKIRNAKIIYEDIPNLFMNKEYKAVTRLISLSLRHGIYPRFIIDTLKHSADFITDFMNVVARVLSRYKIDKFDRFIDNKKIINCPVCDAPLVNDGGCMKCSNDDCGFSRCE